MKYLPPESPLRRLIEINALDAETCEQIIREVEQYVVDVEFTNEDFEECHE